MVSKEFDQKALFYFFYRKQLNDYVQITRLRQEGYVGVEKEIKRIKNYFKFKTLLQVGSPKRFQQAVKDYMQTNQDFHDLSADEYSFEYLAIKNNSFANLSFLIKLKRGDKKGLTKKYAFELINNCFQLQNFEIVGELVGLDKKFFKEIVNNGFRELIQEYVFSYYPKNGCLIFAEICKALNNPIINLIEAMQKSPFNNNDALLREIFMLKFIYRGGPQESLKNYDKHQFELHSEKIGRFLFDGISIPK